MGTPFQQAQMLPPLSIEQIASRASQYDFDPLVPLRYWLRSASSLMKEANIYEREGNDQQAYLLLFRQSQLVLNHILRHPDATAQSNRRALTQARREVETSLSKLEVLKPRIEKSYKRHFQSVRGRETRHATTSVPKEETLPSSTANESLDPALAGRARPLSAEENKDLAVKLAQKELRRRATGKKPPSGGEQTVHRERVREQQPRKRVGFDKDTDLQDDLSSRLQEVGSKVGAPPSERKLAERHRFADNVRNGPENGRGTLTPAIDHKAFTGYQYPVVPPQSELDVAQGPPPLPIKEPHSPAVISPPPLPPRVPSKVPDTILSPDTYSLQQPPPLPSKIPPVSTTPESDHSVGGKGTPSPDLHPSVFTFKPSSYLENGTPLRTIFISPDLRKQFLSIAAPNTRRNLETCGILCGTLISNAFFISKLVIPEQESTSDTCEMVNEAALFEYCDSEDLMLLGWIHTHPSQTCFMSSRDLHTHSGYQAMLSESIAIVCAPSKSPDWGVFRLTDPPGLKTVLACQQSGLFHPHAETNVYTDALRPGHVFEAKGLEFETVDLRPGMR